MGHDYDHSIHSNPDAKAWAEFFIKCKSKNKWTIDNIDEGLMISWFANAMMAEHDHIHQTKIVLDKPAPDLREAGPDLTDDRCKKCIINRDIYLKSTIDELARAKAKHETLVEAVKNVVCRIKNGGTLEIEDEAYRLLKQALKGEGGK